MEAIETEEHETRNSQTPTSETRLISAPGQILRPVQTLSVTQLPEEEASVLLTDTSSRKKTVSIHNKTLKWDDSVNRFWPSSEQSTTKTRIQPPPAKLHLSQHGFNHPNQTFGLSFLRTIRTKELLEGIINHPWFDPVSEIDTHDTTRHYFFLDVETCKEKNYPLYGKGGIRVNQDAEGGRSTHRPRNFSYRIALEEALASLSTHKNAYVVVFECGGNGPKPSALQRAIRHPQLILASLSATPSQLFLPMDQGLPPPAIMQTELRASEKQSIMDDDCSATSAATYSSTSSRPILVSFMGNYRHVVRKRLQELFHNGKDVMLPIPTDYRIAINGSMTQQEAYKGLLRQSRFGFVPRGDNRFSYRFAEVLSAGAIPVVLADDWVLPFSPAVVPWEECLIRVSEAQVSDTLDILRNVSDEEECRMRKKAFQVYDTYLKTARGTIAGIVIGMEAFFTST